MPDATHKQPFTVQIQHDQVDTTEYLLLINDVIVASQPVDPAGVQFPFPEGISPPGTYVFVVVAKGPAGETPSDPVTLVVVPGKPSIPKLLILIG